MYYSNIKKQNYFNLPFVVVVVTVTGVVVALGSSDVVETTGVVVTTSVVVTSIVVVGFSPKVQINTVYFNEI